MIAADKAATLSRSNEDAAAVKDGYGTWVRAAKPDIVDIEQTVMLAPPPQIAQVGTKFPGVKVANPVDLTAAQRPDVSSTYKFQIGPPLPAPRPKGKKK